MKKVLKVLEINTNDNWFTAYNKGAVRGYAIGALAIGAMIGISKIVESFVPKSDSGEENE